MENDLSHHRRHNTIRSASLEATGQARQRSDPPQTLPTTTSQAELEQSSNASSDESHTSNLSNNSSNNSCHRHRGRRGGRGRGDFSSNQDIPRTPNHRGDERPTLKPSPPTNMTSHPATRSVSMPIRPTATTPTPPRPSQTSTFDLNGNQIRELYNTTKTNRNTPHPKNPQHLPPSRMNNRGPEANTPGSSSRTPTASQARAMPISPSPRPHFNASQRISPAGRPPAQRMAGARSPQHWANKQEEFIKVSDVPKQWHTKDIHHAFSKYGNIVRISIQSDSFMNRARVTFRPPPHSALPPRIQSEGVELDWTRGHPHIKEVPSPIDPRRVYCSQNILPVSRLDFGVEIAKKSMLSMRTAQPLRNSGIYLTLDLERKELNVDFPAEISGTKESFRFILPIRLLTHIYQLPSKDSNSTTLIIPFESAPMFLQQAKEGEEYGDHTEFSSFDPNNKDWREWNTWCRETVVCDKSVRETLSSQPLMNYKHAAFIDIGRWTTYRFTINSNICTGPKFQEFHMALADHGVTIEHIKDYSIQPRMSPPLWTILEEEIAGTHAHLECDANASLGFEHQTHLPFRVRYQLEVCLSNGYLKEHSITRGFLERVIDQMTQRSEEHVVGILEKVADNKHVLCNPMDIFTLRPKEAQKNIPSYCTLTRSAVITPTSIHVASPIMETSNRIIRKYSADADRFIRVKFADEKTEGKLRNHPHDRAEAVFNRVRRAMKYGIVVAGRYYEFLAFGNSQFREHGAYFYAPTASKSADEIRASLGQFDHIKTVAKYGARIGQCFSTTRTMAVRSKIVQIPDIERNGFTFSDGVGKLSMFMAQMAAKELGLSFHDPPSLFQFRLGGCKGVLTLDPNLVGSEVHIRPSQRKFEAVSDRLEIIRPSSFATPYLNRQIVLVLAKLGVSDSVIIQMQRDMLNDYEKAMIDHDTAIQKLRRHIDHNHTTLTMASMVLDGFMQTKEPFLMSLLQLWRSCTVKGLKEKARIAIEDGAFVLGCVDETGTLKGHSDDPEVDFPSRDEALKNLPEIFIQVDDVNKKGEYRVIEEVCLLARNPTLHPGDIRVVRAVDVPALHHLKNVVVLPQTGDRDLANMCSGGDLDGDDYMVLWDNKLIPTTINVRPMDFTPEKPDERDAPITAEDISDFLVTYMKNDTLGQIAHAHLAQADQEPDGVFSETCLELAKLHSQAVDYPKSGIAAEMNHQLRPRKWPHFMEKKHKPANQQYKSGKVLGKLYDEVQLVEFKPQWENSFDERVLGAFKLRTDILESAESLKMQYDDGLRRLMAKHGVRTEFEAWSVFILEHNHEKNDYKFAEDFGTLIHTFQAHYREMCLATAARKAAAQGMSLDDKWSYQAPFIAAMYTVTAQEVEEAIRSDRTRNPDNMPMISFPWLFPAELGKIATSKSGEQLKNSKNAEDSKTLENLRVSSTDLSRAPAVKDKVKVVVDSSLSREEEEMKLNQMFSAIRSP